MICAKCDNEYKGQNWQYIKKKNKQDQLTFSPRRQTDWFHVADVMVTAGEGGLIAAVHSFPAFGSPFPVPRYQF